MTWTTTIVAKKFVLNSWFAILAVNIVKLVLLSYVSSRSYGSFGVAFVSGVTQFDWFVTVTTFLLSGFGVFYLTSPEERLAKINKVPQFEPYIWLSVVAMYVVFWLATFTGQIGYTNQCLAFADATDSLWWRYNYVGYVAVAKDVCYVLVVNNVFSSVAFALFVVVLLSYSFKAHTHRLSQQHTPAVPATSSPAPGESQA